MSQSGSTLLEELLRKPPGEVTSWALDQVQVLSRPGADVQASPLFQVAGALGSLPPERRQQFVASAVQGYQELPASRKAEALRVVMQHAPQLQASNLQTEVRGSGSSGSRREAPPALEAEAPPLIANLAQVAAQVNIQDMSQKEVEDMQHVVQAEAVKVVQPKEVLEVVKELDPKERETLTQTLVDAHIVPEEQRMMLEEAVRPGGYTDKLADAMAWAAFAREYAWVAIALPVLECVLSWMFQCPLANWLGTDAGIGLGTALATGAAAYMLAPAYDKLQQDPMGSMQRAFAAEPPRASSSDGPGQPLTQPAQASGLAILADVEAKARPMVEAAALGVPYEVVRRAGLCLLLALALVVLGTFWSVIGLLELLASGLFGCSSGVVFLSFLFVTLRLAVVAGLLAILFYVWQEVEKHRSLTLGTAIPMDGP